MLAKDLFVCVLMIDLLNMSMRILAIFTIWAILLFEDIRAHLFGIKISIPFFVLLCMKVWAMSVKMRISFFAGSSFKIIDVQ